MEMKELKRYLLLYKKYISFHFLSFDLLCCAISSTVNILGEKMKKLLIVLSICTSINSFSKDFPVSDSIVQSNISINCFDDSSVEFVADNLKLTGMASDHSKMIIEKRAKIENSTVLVSGRKFGNISSREMDELQSRVDECLASEDRSLENITSVNINLIKGIVLKDLKLEEKYCVYDGPTIFESAFNFTGERARNYYESIYLNDNYVTSEVTNRDTTTCISARTIIDGTTGTIVAPFAAIWIGGKFILKSLITSILD